MATIKLKTIIKAPTQRCFELSISIDLHKISASKTKEEAIDGVINGLIFLNETVTWRAKHFGFWHKMKVKITAYNKPNYFVDEMISGPFKLMKHRHEFREVNNATIMIDEFEFASPVGFIGKIIDALFLKKYMMNFLIDRNKIIKEYAESDKWYNVINP